MNVHTAWGIMPIGEWTSENQKQGEGKTNSEVCPQEPEKTENKAKADRPKPERIALKRVMVSRPIPSNYLVEREGILIHPNEVINGHTMTCVKVPPGIREDYLKEWWKLRLPLNNFVVLDETSQLNLLKMWQMINDLLQKKGDCIRLLNKLKQSIYVERI